MTNKEYLDEAKRISHEIIDWESESITSEGKTLRNKARDLIEKYNSIDKTSIKQRKYPFKLADFHYSSLTNLLTRRNLLLYDDTGEVITEIISPIMHACLLGFNRRNAEDIYCKNTNEWIGIKLVFPLHITYRFYYYVIELIEEELNTLST
jgi:hypothetical protein